MRTILRIYLKYILTRIIMYKQIIVIQYKYIYKFHIMKSFKNLNLFKLRENKIISFCFLYEKLKENISH